MTIRAMVVRLVGFRKAVSPAAMYGLGLGTPCSNDSQASVIPFITPHGPLRN